MNDDMFISVRALLFMPESQSMQYLMCNNSGIIAISIQIDDIESLCLHSNF